MGSVSSPAIHEMFIVGESEEMAEVIEAVEEIGCGDSDKPALIEGERGTGRELVARAIHYASKRRDGSFVSVAAAIPGPLMEDELGTRATALRRADGGTLLIKDVASLPRGPQRRLLRLLGDKHGGADAERFDVRVIGAAEGELESAVAAEAFDRELFGHLGSCRIRIPPLRRRTADIPRLAAHFIRHYADEAGRGRMTISSRAIERLTQYPWPGNVAELKDMARRLVIRVKRGPIEASDVDPLLPRVAERVPLEDMGFEEMIQAKLKGFLRDLDGYPVENLYDEIISRVERPLLALVMEHTGGSQVRAAEILGLNRNTLRKKLSHIGLGGRK